MSSLSTSGAIRSITLLGFVSSGLATISFVVLVFSLLFSLGSALQETPPAFCESGNTPTASSVMELCAAPGEERSWQLSLGTTLKSKAGVYNWASPAGVTCAMSDPARGASVVSRTRSLEDDQRYNRIWRIEGYRAELKIGGSFTVPDLSLGGSGTITLQGTCTGTVFYPEPQEKALVERRVDLNVPVQLHIAEKYRYQPPSNPYPKAALLSFVTLVATGLAAAWFLGGSIKSIEELRDEQVLHKLALSWISMESDTAKERLKELSAKRSS